AGLTDDAVDGDRRFACCAIANEELALTASDWNHRVNWHDAGLNRLIHTAALDHARCNFLQRIKRVAFDWTFTIERLTECIDYATEQRLADGNRKESASCFGFVAFFNQRIVA